MTGNYVWLQYTTENANCIVGVATKCSHINMDQYFLHLNGDRFAFNILTQMVIVLWVLQQNVLT